MLSLRYPMEVNLVGDAAETLRALLPLLERKQNTAWREEIAKNITQLVENSRGARPASRATPVKSSTGDLGSLPHDYQNGSFSLVIRVPAPTGMPRDLKIRRGMMASLSGGLASMGAAVPYAIAAKFAHPDCPVSRSSAMALCR